MPSFQDSAVIFFIALLLFGPKKLPELARYVGKLMNEFRRASNEFRMQMEEEFRQSEQEEHRKKIAAMEAAAPVTPALPVETYEQPALEAETRSEPIAEVPETFEAAPEATPEPLPIASSGDLNLMPPATGLPVARTLSSSPLGAMFDSIPHTPDPALAHAQTEAQTEAHSEVQTHG